MTIELRPFGSSGSQLSLLGFGAAPLGGEYGGLDVAEGRRAVHAAIDGGINFFDVAPYYGRTLAEERLGEALLGKREQVFLSSKCARFGLERFDFSAARVATSVEESLARLRCEHLDLLIVHDVEFGLEAQIVEETLPAAFALREQGKVRHVGISGLPVRYLRRVAEQVPGLDAILSYAHYTLLSDLLDQHLTPWCAQQGIALINASPLALGLLTQAGPQDWHRAPAEVLAIGPQVADLCKQHGRDVAEVALRFAFDHPTVCSTLTGMSTVEQVHANLRVLDQRSDPELLAKIQDLVAPVYNQMWQEGRAENTDPPGPKDGHSSVKIR